VTGSSRHHPHRKRLVGFGYLRRLGPGLVTGASDDDPSGIGTYSQVGAAFRFGLLWTALVCLPLASAVQEVAARLGLVTGKGLAALIRVKFPRVVLYGAVSLVVGANVFNIGADLGSMAAATQLLLPIPYVPTLIAITAIVLALEVFVSYQRYAKILRWLTISLVSYIAVLFIVRVDWREVVHATFLPNLRSDQSYIAALIAVFGTTISPYLFFWQSSEEVEEEHTRGDVVDRQHLRAMRVDVVSGMVSAVVVMFAIQVAAAVTLGAHGATTIQSADQAARALEPVAGRLASLLFATGIVGTGAVRCSRSGGRRVPHARGRSACRVARGLRRRADWAPLGSRVPHRRSTVRRYHSTRLTDYSTEPGIVVWRARYAAASARRATSSFERIEET
jgi:Mn2+/Fe2+ NRAMP family transporter